ncbi:MAG: hypothetical protein WC523_06380 [Patescibacteria group bacterium]
MNGTNIVFMVALAFLLIQSIYFFVRWYKEIRQSGTPKKIIEVNQWFVSYFSTGVPSNPHEPFRSLIKLPFAKAKKCFSNSLDQFLSHRINQKNLEYLGMIVLDLDEINNPKNFPGPKSFEDFSDWFETSLEFALKELKNNPSQAVTMYLNTLVIGTTNPNIPCNNKGKEYFERILRSDSEWAIMFFVLLQAEIKAREVEPTWLDEDQRIILMGEILKLQEYLNITITMLKKETDITSKET